MDEVAEQQNVSREISEAISTPIGYGKDLHFLIDTEFILVSQNY